MTYQIADEKAVIVPNHNPDLHVVKYYTDERGIGELAFEPVVAFVIETYRPRERDAETHCNIPTPITTVEHYWDDYCVYYDMKTKFWHEPETDCGQDKAALFSYMKRRDEEKRKAEEERRKRRAEERRQKSAEPTLTEKLNPQGT